MADDRLSPHRARLRNRTVDQVPRASLQGGAADQVRAKQLGEVEVPVQVKLSRVSYDKTCHQHATFGHTCSILKGHREDTIDTIVRPTYGLRRVPTALWGKSTLVVEEPQH